MITMTKTKISATRKFEEAAFWVMMVSTVVVFSVSFAGLVA
jgi:hypothetical protein